MTDLVIEFIDKVAEKNELQKKYLENWKATDAERNELNTILHFFVDEFNYDIDFIADAYIFINNMVMEETYYFIVNGKYRNSTFEEVNKIVYDNPQYMEKYMMGLSVSDYIWINHIKMLRYFEENIKLFSGKNYLEIGPGFGQYLVKALLNCNFESYTACDISQTSVDRSNKYLKYRDIDDKCTVIQKDFFEYSSDECFDCVVMGEVLEHVEQPLLMIKKIYELLNKDGKAFITTVINAPAVDHISLFSSIEQVLNMAESAGFEVLDYMYSTEGDILLEKAVKRKQAINIAMILKK
ncbi:MAG: class I SAM-dependent methyltransferase [Lachnospiraceae bacterium]|nr:class I SAM-dependent methyltransferase [Lachnospiraceae bacterium]